MGTDTVIAISAAIIALASLFVSIWSAVATRKHNRLSVTPHLRVDYSHKPGEPVRVILSNNGIGTAIIKNFAIYLDGTLLTAKAAGGLTEALSKTGITGYFFAYTLSSDDAVSSGEHMDLLSFSIKNNLEEMAKVQASLSRISFRIDYGSMYGDKFCLQRTALGNAAQGRA